MRTGGGGGRTTLFNQWQADRCGTRGSQSGGWNCERDHAHLRRDSFSASTPGRPRAPPRRRRRPKSRLPRQQEMSFYTAANGTTMPNRGEKTITFMTMEGHSCMLKLQAADVQQPLTSVSRICDAGHHAVSHCQGETSSARTPSKPPPFTETTMSTGWRYRQWGRRRWVSRGRGSGPHGSSL